MSPQPLLRSALLAGAVVLSFASIPSNAATKSANFQVLATMVSDCTIISITNVDFGSVGVLSNDLDTIATLTVACTPGTSYTVSLNAGTGAGSTITDRRMGSAGGGSLKYQLFRDAARTQNWGNTPGTDTQGGTGNGSNNAYTIYARLPTQTAPAIGSYTSTVTATITY
ncbi:Csu type fimbrial protein [Lysobacter auxotrophicus]|uniref:Spore coat U domain-containing protein n=1 Tax=Lysobacter auxotrophicus TaxID=2992573 RepID=A0ABN6UIR8_9GAMM|nr:spore coat U domain-containing protein [Lysobacter auxotrophicus]BDU16235.1 spore coat U domain-containing protein [Lysobacter auxotrophicus]